MNDKDEVTVAIKLLNDTRAKLEKELGEHEAHIKRIKAALAQLPRTEKRVRKSRGDKGQKRDGAAQAQERVS